MKFAHLIKTAGAYTLLITPTNRPVDAEQEIAVTGKTHARLIAFREGAKPWNF